MSIQSSIYADYANIVKDEWTEKLKAALLIHGDKDLPEIWELLTKMENFEFGE